MRIKDFIKTKLKTPSPPMQESDASMDSVWDEEPVVDEEPMVDEESPLVEESSMEEDSMSDQDFVQLSNEDLLHDEEDIPEGGPIKDDGPVQKKEKTPALDDVPSPEEDFIQSEEAENPEPGEEPALNSSKTGPRLFNSQNSNKNTDDEQTKITALALPSSFDPFDPQGRRRRLVTIPRIAGALLMVYLGGVIFFDFHFYPGTTLDNVPVSMCTADGAKNQLEESLNENALTLKGMYTQDTITEAQAGAAYQYDLSLYNEEEAFIIDDIVKFYLGKQNQFLWPVCFLIPEGDKQFELQKSYDTNVMGSLLDGLDCMTNETTEPEAAYLDYQDGQYVIVPEQLGTALDEQELQGAIVDAFEQGQETLELSEFYERPDVLADDETLVAAMEHGNTVQNMDFVLQDGIREITVPADAIRSLLTIENNTVRIDMERAADYAGTLANLNPDGTADPVDAHVEYQAGNGFVIIPETTGTRISEDSFAAALAAAVDAETTTIDAASAYAPAEIRSDSEGLAAAVTEANAILNTSITIRNDYHSVTLEASDIASMITISGSEVSVDEDAVRAWVQEHEAGSFSHVGATRRITTASNEVITLSTRTYGNQVDVEAETEQLIADLKGKETVTREPVYSYEEWGSSSENDGIGYTFIDVDLSAQTVYLVNSGQCVYTAPMVSGDPTTGKSTPTGIYYVTLRTTEPNEKRYNVEVEHWMSLGSSVGISIHDAGWRDVFGGTIYEGDGSNGNIELTREAAEYLYENTRLGVPVIIH